MRVDFLTCVVNGMPFIRHHLPVFETLKLDWHWHIYEGISHNPFCPNSIRPEMHKNSLSIDGTTEYLDTIKASPRVTVYRTNDWQNTYLTARFQQMLATVTKPTLAWEVDVDEYWTAEQVETMARMFDQFPDKTAAWFFCRFFVGPKLMLRDCTRDGGAHEWRRAWRHDPTMSYTTHDAPIVMDRQGRSVFHLNPFKQNETVAAGLVFDHYAYVTEKQVLFKEQRYGYGNAVRDWRRLQDYCGPFPVPLTNFFGWLWSVPVELAPTEHCFRENP